MLREGLAVPGGPAPRGPAAPPGGPAGGRGAGPAGGGGAGHSAPPRLLLLRRPTSETTSDHRLHRGQEVNVDCSVPQTQDAASLQRALRRVCLAAGEEGEVDQRAKCSIMTLRAPCGIITLTVPNFWLKVMLIIEMFAHRKDMFH